MLSIASTVPFCTWDKNNYVPLAHQTPLFQEKNWKVFCPPIALVFDCVWYHLCINAQHSSNPCEQMELCRSVTWFFKTAESSMPHLKFLPCLLTGKATDDRHHQVQKPPLNCRQCKSFTWMGKKLEVLLLKHWSLIALQNIFYHMHGMVLVDGINRIYFLFILNLWPPFWA